VSTWICQYVKSQLEEEVKEHCQDVDGYECDDHLLIQLVNPVEPIAGRLVDPVNKWALGVVSFPTLTINKFYFFNVSARNSV
jgi:hypothetical protein